MSTSDNHKEINYKLWLIYLGKCTWEMWFHVCVCFHHNQRREYAAVSPWGWWNNKKFVQVSVWTQVWKELESKEDIIGHIWARAHLCLYLSEGGRLHVTLYILMTSVRHMSPPFTAVSFGLESQRWVSSNNENNQCIPIATPLPIPLSPTSWETGCYGFDIRDA